MKTCIKHLLRIRHLGVAFKTRRNLALVYLPARHKLLYLGHVGPPESFCPGLLGLLQ